MHIRAVSEYVIIYKHTKNYVCVVFFRLLREQWIRAKYERNEFEFIEKQEPYSAGRCSLNTFVP